MFFITRISVMPTLPKALLPFFLHFLKKEWKWFAAAQFLSLAWALDHTLWPYVFKMFIDTLVNYTSDKADAWSIVSKPLSLACVLWIYIEYSFRGSGIIMARTFPRYEASIRLAMFDYVSQHSHAYFANHFAGAIANKISDMPQSATRIAQLCMTLFFPALAALLIATAIFITIQPIFAIILVGWVAVHMAICLGSARKCDRLSDIHSEARSDLSGKIVDSLTNIINVKLFARRAYEKSYLAHYQEDEREKHWQALWYIEKTRLLLGICCFLGVGVAMFGALVYQWQHNHITIAEVVYIFNTTWNITLIAWISGIELPNLYKEIGVCRQALSVIEPPHEVMDKPEAKALNVTKGEIVFDNVTFRYAKNNNIFSDKSLTIHAGQKVGLVGFSGSGKTTFVNLILRYFDIESGQILIDGQNISNVTQDSLRQHIAMIPQDTTLFHRSLMDNIRYGREDASDEEVLAASRQAHCEEFISKLPEGYNTLVGERGIKLSGGQRQRIAIARAMLKNAPILILDEATSALDSLTERKIQESLHSLMQGRTTIVIAHRLSTLADMDRIVVFKDGEVIEDGNHAELIEEDGHYAMLWEMQAGGFLPEKETPGED